MTPRALVVDDEPDICELLTLTLGRMDIATDAAGDVGAAKARLGETRYDLCLTDMRLPDGDGLELVEWMQSNAPDVPPPPWDYMPFEGDPTSDDVILMLSHGADLTDATTLGPGESLTVSTVMLDACERMSVPCVPPVLAANVV